MLVIVDGGDCTGKTTVAKICLRIFNILFLDSKNVIYKPIITTQFLSKYHSRVLSDHEYITSFVINTIICDMLSLFKKEILENKLNLVIDRFHYSEEVYGYIRGKTLQNFSDIERFLIQFDPIVFYCRCKNKNFLTKKLKKRKEKYIQEAYELFDKVFQKTILNYVTIDISRQSRKTIAEIVYSIIKFKHK